MNTFNWNEIYTNTSPKLLGICRRYIKDIATAEDIIQDSFIVAIQKQDTLKDKNALNGWLSRIVINMAIHHLKDAKKINFSTHQDYEIVDSNTVMNTLELDNKSILLSSDLERTDILDAIDKLPEHHKSVFNMYVIDQFSHSEISKVLNISVGTSKSHLSRARKTIQGFLLEKIKGKPLDEKKKRRIAFLFFLGFGNQMFANFYKDKFKGFEIEPQKPFNIDTKNIQLPTQFVGLTKMAFASKIAVATISSLIVMATIFYAFVCNLEPISIQEEIKSDTEIQNIKTNDVVLSVSHDSLKKDNNAIEKNQEKTIVSVPKKEIQTSKKISKIQTKPSVTTPIDSSKNEPQKVIVIKKQIIKKDTVYVTK